MSPLVYVVILNWNGKFDTLECLASVESLSYPNFQVVVVDNCSNDGSVAAIHAAFPQFLVLVNNKNLGYAGGNNVGIRHALENNAEFILVLNNDTIVSPELISQLLLGATQYPKAGILGARLLYHDRPDIVWFDNAKWNASLNHFEYPGQNENVSSLGVSDHDTDYVCGAALFIRSVAVQQIGLMDERYYLVWEEVDWCYRAREAGWQCIVIPQALVWHKVGSSFGGEASPLRTYFSIRNALLWYGRYPGTRAFLRLLGKHLPKAFPAFVVSKNKNHRLTKRIWWALCDWFSAEQHPQQWATRRAILDYFFKRLGNCPDRVRTISSAWGK